MVNSFTNIIARGKNYEKYVQKKHFSTKTSFFKRTVLHSIKVIKSSQSGSQYTADQYQHQPMQNQNSSNSQQMTAQQQAQQQSSFYEQQILYQQQVQQQQAQMANGYQQQQSVPTSPTTSTGGELKVKNELKTRIFSVYTFDLLHDRHIFPHAIEPTKFQPKFRFATKFPAPAPSSTEFRCKFSTIEHCLRGTGREKEKEEENKENKNKKVRNAFVQKLIKL